MSVKNQLKIDYKLEPLAFAQAERIPTESNTTYDHIQTPGWSSMVRTEPNVGQTNQTSSRHNQILQKLSKLDHINLSNSQFSKIRVNNNANHLSHINAANTLSISMINKENSQIHLRSFNDQQKQKRLESTTMPSQSRIQLEHSHQGSRQNRPKKRVRTITTLKNKTQDMQASRKQTERQKRFNHITVHQHLYLDSKRQETKRMMERVMEQQYKKQNVLLFKPHISKKSQELAQIKFSRLRKLQQMESQLIQELNQLNKLQNQVKITNATQKKRIEKNRYESVNKMFNFLSDNSEVITKETLKEVIQELPLACIKVLQIIIEKIYQGKSYCWLQFLSSVNDKKLIPNRQSLLVIFDKWSNRKNKSN